MKRIQTTLLVPISRFLPLIDTGNRLLCKEWGPSPLGADDVVWLLSEYFGPGGRPIWRLRGPLGGVAPILVLIFEVGALGGSRWDCSWV
jgi:hypothetical protein